jgi:uncharacterized membrane protein
MNRFQSLYRSFFTLAFRGILAVFPLVMTLFLIYWILASLERWVGSLLLFVLPDTLYFPGMGVALGVLLLLVAGWLVNAYFIQNLIMLGESLLERIPLVKTIYTGLRDLVGFLGSAKKQPAGSVVLVQMGKAKVIGFVTDWNASRTLHKDEGDLVGVYLPLGYMIGGYTVYLERSEMETLDIGAEEAMRLVLTGGMASGKGKMTGV